MTLEFTNAFEADYDHLRNQIQKQTHKALKLLAANPQHPSLQVKRIQGTHDVWEARVTLAYRLTFNWKGDLITLRRVGMHDILKKKKK